MTYKYHKLLVDYETMVKEFCGRLWGWRKNIKIQVLNKEEFKKLDKSEKCDAFVEHSKEKDNVLGVDIGIHTIKLLDSGKGICVESLMHELLHVHKTAGFRKGNHTNTNMAFLEFSNMGKTLR